MKFIIFVSIFAIIFFLLAGSALLLLIKKLFKLKDPSYKKSFIILALSGITSAAVWMLLSLFPLGILSDFLVAIMTFFIFHYFLKKYYQSSWKKSLGIYVVFEIAAIIVAFFAMISLRLFIFSPFFVAGESMSPTYNNHDYVLVNKLDKDFMRGDIVIFREKEKGAYLIERIIGLPLEKVEVKDGKVWINDQILNENYYRGDTPGNIVLTLSQDQYFVMGDNRQQSSDSRTFGPIEKSRIVGTVFYKFSGIIK